MRDEMSWCILFVEDTVMVDNLEQVLVRSYKFGDKTYRLLS